MKNLKRKKHIRKKYIYHKLIKKLNISLIIIFILLTISIYKIYIENTSLYIVFFGLIVWTLFWYILGRMYKIHWHERKKQIISKIDTIWVFFLIAYIAIELWKSWIFSPIIPSTELWTFWIILVSWLFIGRFFYMVNSIKKIIKKKR